MGARPAQRTSGEWSTRSAVAADCPGLPASWSSCYLGRTHLHASSGWPQAQVDLALSQRYLGLPGGGGEEPALHHIQLRKLAFPLPPAQAAVSPRCLSVGGTLGLFGALLPLLALQPWVLPQPQSQH